MKSAIINLSIVSVALVLSIIGYVWWHSVLVKKSVSVVNLEHLIVAKMEAAGRIAAARATLSEIEGDEKIVQSYFVSKSDIVAFIDGLESQGRFLGSSVDVLSVAPLDSADRPMLALTLSVKGSFDAVMRTVGALEYSPYDLSVETFSIEQSTTGEWVANVKILVGSIHANTKTRPSIQTTKTTIL